MSLKKVMYNQHVPYMHTPISAFACYNTPLQASYQSDTCKRRTTKRMFYICFTTCVNSERRSLIHKSMVGVWLSCHLPLGSNVCSGEPPRQSPLCPPLSKLMRKKSHWRTVICVRFFILTEFYGQTLCVCRACFPTCISQLTSSPWQPAVLSPNCTHSHTSPEVLREHLVYSPLFGTPQVTSGGSGSVISPYCHKVSIRPCLSPLVLPRQ